MVSPSSNDALSPYDERCISIALATCALKGHRPAGVPESKKVYANANRILQHITTLLTTGTLDDPYAARVIAVTAKVQSEAIDSLIITKNSPGNKTQSKELTLRPELDTIEPAANGKQVLDMWKTFECVPHMLLCLYAAQGVDIVQPHWRQSYHLLPESLCYSRLVPRFTKILRTLR